jgi:pre-rRNA-processing protein IPI1
VILPNLLPLILDGNNGVRAQLLKFFRSLPHEEVEDHVTQLMPYIRAGMTHLAADIRVSSVEILSWLLQAAGNEVVSCAGGWIKTMNCFLSLLGWHSEESTKWSSSRASFGKAGSEGKPMVKALQTFAAFLRAGIGNLEEDAMDSEDEGNAATTTRTWVFPLCQTSQHMLPSKSSPFAHLSLFGAPRNDDGEMYESREARYRVFSQKFQGPVARGIDAARKEGGDLGRASTVAAKVLREAIIGGPGS